MTDSMIHHPVAGALPLALISESRELLDALGGWPALASLAPADLRTALRQATPTAQSLLTAIRQVLQPPTIPLQVNSPRTLAGWLMADMGHLEQEELRVVLLDTKHVVLDVVTVYIGTVNRIEVRLAELFKPAVALGAVGLILVHNHPSHMPAQSSPEDHTLTREAVAAGRLLRIDIVDHLIVAKGSYASLRERSPDLFRLI